jgi:hypothetical protein
MPDGCNPDQTDPIPVVRRIITGQTPAGVSRFTHVEEVERQIGPWDIGLHRIWEWDEIPTLPFYDGRPYAPENTPKPSRPRGAAGIFMVVIPPGLGAVSPSGSSKAMSLGDRERRSAAIRDVTRNRRAVADLETGGMHCTDDVDIGFVISGESQLEQADGTEVTLRVGDVYVQNGTVHAMHNRTGKPCVIGVVTIGTGPYQWPQDC